MIYSKTARKETLRLITDAIHIPFWLDDPARPAPEAELTRAISTDLLVIGAGFTGLWTALLAKEADPSRICLILRRVRWHRRDRNGDSWTPPSHTDSEWPGRGW